MKSTIIVSVLPLTSSAFIPSGLPIARSQETALSFGFNGLGSSKEKKVDDGAKKAEKKISAGGLIQLLTAGMGAPFLGDFEGVDEETGKFMFSLEANNLVDENGESKQTKMPYFENGWVEEKDVSAPDSQGGFRFPWEN